MPSSAEGSLGRVLKQGATTTAPYISPLLPKRRETEVPRGNDLKKTSPNLIIYITALIIINIA